MTLAELLVSSVVVLQAVASGGGPGSVPPLPSDVEVTATILRAEDRREATSELLALAQSPDAAIRARSMLAVGRIGLPRGLPVLLEALRDSDVEVRSMAAFAIGKLELDLSPASEDALRTRAVEGLVGVLEDPDVAPMAAWSLGQLATEPARVAISAWLPAVLHGEVPEAMGVALLQAWWRLPGATADALIGAARSRSAQIRLAAAFALRRLDDPNGQPELLSLLDDEDSRVRAQAVRGLSSAPLTLAEDRAPRMLMDRDWRVTVEALAWLATAWSRALEDEGRREQISDAAVGEVVRMSLDRNLHVRRMSLHALGVVASEWGVAAQRLREALDDPEPSVRIVALDECGRSGAARGIVERVRARYGLEDPRAVVVAGADPLESAAVVRLLAAASDEADVGFLRRVVRIGDLPTRAAALGALSASDGARLAEEVDLAFTSGHPVLAGVAAEKLSEIAADGRLAEIPEPGVGWGGYLWARQARMTSAAALEPRLLMLAAIEEIDNAMFHGRRSVLLDDDDRVVRLWAARRAVEASGLPGTVPGPTTAEDLMDAAARPQDTGRDRRAYLDLATRALARQAQPPTLEVETPRGTFAIELDARSAPLTVDAVLGWVDGGDYDQVVFHRVVPDFVIQGGDPTATGYGGASPTLRNEESPIAYVEGTVGIALAGRDTGSSQWFVTHSAQPHLTGVYPILGRVVEGQRTVDRIQPGDALRVTLRERDS